jgi:predicted ATPase
MSKVRIKSITIKGYKSIYSLENFEPRSVNILIGPNGAGKSNFISFFRMLSWCVSSVDQFQNYIAESGFASALLFDKIATEIQTHLVLETSSGTNEYFSRLVHGAGDILFFADEKVRYSKKDHGKVNPVWTSLGAAHKESKLFEFSATNTTVKTISALLKQIAVYQFHDTSPKSAIRNRWKVSDGRWLKESGANLGSNLYHLYKNHPNEYTKIIKHIKLVLPFFTDFVFEEERGSMLLRWVEWSSPYLTFDVSQASDGMLRYIAVVTLLCQPHNSLPAAIFIDEPELGLHPSAIAQVAGLIKTASRYCQVFVATQSPILIDMFEPEEVTVVERDGRASKFTRLNTDELKSWLEEYSLSELWEKNVFGGKP